MGRPAVQPPGVAQRLQRWTPSEWPLAGDWKVIVESFLRSDAGQQLGAFVTQRLAQGTLIYPTEPFRALRLTPRASVRVVILGQDPYHGPGQAEGLAFSVPQGVAAPPSLRNIHKELQRDLGPSSLASASATPTGTASTPVSTSLRPWAEQGVLLLNACLTVEDGQAASHAGRGWEALTDAILADVARHAAHCVYMLWGGHAQKKAALIEQEAASCGHEALILSANHPSPLSANRGPRPFIGCGHFSAASAWLARRGSAIRWQLR
jgi:uracil-DNA glycosylase